jgi:hypothetical protein
MIWSGSAATYGDVVPAGFRAVREPRFACVSYRVPQTFFRRRINCAAPWGTRDLAGVRWRWPRCSRLMSGEACASNRSFISWRAIGRRPAAASGRALICRHSLGAQSDRADSPAASPSTVPGRSRADGEKRWPSKTRKPSWACS